MKSSKHMLCQAVAVACSVMAASAAMAQSVPTLVGGGSSLIAPAIGAEITALDNSQANISYSAVGSGRGQLGFLNNDPTQFGLPASAAPVDFGNSETALSATQISNYSGNVPNAAFDPLIQIPYVVTPITIPLVNAPPRQLPHNTSGMYVDIGNSGVCVAPVMGR